MRKYFSIISALVFVITVVLVGCEKKTEAPKPVESSVAPAAPAAPAPAEPAPDPAPAPAPEPSKPAKK